MRHSWSLAAILVGCVGGGLAGNACKAEPETSSSSGDPASASSGAAGAGGATSSGSGEGGIDVTGSGGMSNCNPMSENDDIDMDGFTPKLGDCDDCNALVNPDAVEVIADPETDGGAPPPADEDCDGTKDNIAPPCDSGLLLDDPDPMNAAKAIGACKYVTKASWVLADGSPPPVDVDQLAAFHVGHGILPDLGPNVSPQEGAALLMLSSGTARRETDPGFIHRNNDKKYNSGAPFGFPKESATCPGIVTGSATDATGLELEFKAPSNAKGIEFDFNFFTYEWPQFICTQFNDFFVANLVLSGGNFPNGQTDGNVSFDMGMNPISVNNAFLDICGCPSGPPCSVPPNKPVVKTFDCMFGNMGVTGTDYDQDSIAGWTNGSTGWLRTSAPVDPGKKFTIRFVTYDSGDHNVDSSALVDNWQWTATPGSGTIIAPPK